MTHRCPICGAKRTAKGQGHQYCPCIPKAPARMIELSVTRAVTRALQVLGPKTLTKKG